MRISRRGSFIIIASAITAISSVMFHDVLIVTAFLVLLAIVVLEAVWMAVVVRKPERWFAVYRGQARDRRAVKKTLFPGDKAQDTLYLAKRVGGTAGISSRLSFLRFSPSVFRGPHEANAVLAEFQTPFAGRYHSDRIELDVTGPLKLLEQRCSLKADFDYSVYPRTLEVAQESVEILGGIETGDFSIDLPGTGTEFYEVRRYQPGDDARRINWKSTAKHGELMVNEGMKEVAAPYYLVLEAVSPTYFDRDRLAATFLGLANVLATFQARFGILIHDGEKVNKLTRIDQSSTSLVVALKEALNFVEPDGIGLGEELSQMVGGSFARAMRAYEGKGIYTVSELVDLGHLQREMLVRNQDVVRTVTQLVEGADEPPAFFYVSGLFTRLDALLEVAWRVSRIYGTRFIVADPAAPWIAARDENEASELYLAHQRRLDALRSAGVEYYAGEPSSMVQRISSFRS